MMSILAKLPGEQFVYHPGILVELFRFLEVPLYFPASFRVVSLACNNTAHAWRHRLFAARFFSCNLGRQ
jgi:hypothetical protein